MTDRGVCGRYRLAVLTLAAFFVCIPAPYVHAAEIDASPVDKTLTDSALT